MNKWIWVAMMAVGGTSPAQEIRQDRPEWNNLDVLEINRELPRATMMIYPDADLEWLAPELPLDDGQVLVLDADDPFHADEWPVDREG